MDEPVQARELQAEPLKSNQATVIYLVGVLFLGIVATICSAGAVFLAWSGKEVPVALLQTCGTALTLIGALFVARAASTAAK